MEIIEKNTFTEQEVEEFLSEFAEQQSDKILPIEFSTENLVDVKFDEKAFQEGMSEISKTCGIISGLFNVGCGEAFVLDYLLNQQTIDYNLKNAEITKDMNVEIARHQKVIMDKQEL